jgi:2-polyprenyl-6-hydroxyphenyl methylase / 3-demethylubiquinone-9 3-methyltransferase
MKKVPEEIYARINNKVYNLEGHKWWDEDFSLNLIRKVLNPVRVDYISKTIGKVLRTPPSELNVLEVGCGGGLLSEEIANLGYNTTGVDPSEQSLNTAARHALENNLSIIYRKGYGENLPFEPESFDVVLCCDVLEHVSDLPQVISEISRVLKHNGVFIYDTFNRNFFSKITAIAILQKWKRWAIMPPDLHVWEMFIKPAEIKTLLSLNHLMWKEHRGVKPGIPYLKMLHLLHLRASGLLTYEEFGRKVNLVQNRSTLLMYMGYAVKQPESASS